MYIGAVIETAPIPRPPIILQTENCGKLLANQTPSEDTAKQTAQAASAFFRPKESAMLPAPAVPAMQPINAHPAAQPVAAALR
jgi:hypothetical protein